MFNFKKSFIKDNYTQENISLMNFSREVKERKTFQGQINIKNISEDNSLKNIEIYSDDDLVATLYKTISSTSSGIVQGISTATGDMFAIDFYKDTFYLNPNWVRLATLDNDVSIVHRERCSYLSIQNKEQALEGSYFASGKDWVCTQKIMNRDKRGKLCIDIKYFLYEATGKFIGEASNFAVVKDQPVLSNAEMLYWKK